MPSNKLMTLTDVEAMIDRLTKSKQPKTENTQPQNGPRLTKAEVDELFDRLAKHRKILSPKVPRKSSELSQDEIDKIVDRLSKAKAIPPPAPVYRGEVRTQMDIDRMVERLSGAKKSPESPEVKSRLSDSKLSQNAVQDLVTRLSNKDIALRKTPDTNRVTNRKYGIVSSYAWNGCNYQAILCNEESP